MVPTLAAADNPCKISPTPEANLPSWASSSKRFPRSLEVAQLIKLFSKLPVIVEKPLIKPLHEGVAPTEEFEVGFASPPMICC